MWDAITGAVSSATNAVVAATVGTGEQCPFSCQVPFKKFDQSMDGCEVFSELFHSEAIAMRDSDRWTDMEFADPDEGGDMKAFTQDQIGTYHFVKATFTIPNAVSSDVLDLLVSDQKDVRRRFSEGLERLEFIGEKGSCSLLHIAYAAPTGAAGRDFVFLAGEKREAGTPTLEAWGCSVDIPSLPEDYEGYVRGACLYHWGVTQDGDSVKCVYTSCFDPRGWAPPFIISWFKSSATDEFRKLRELSDRSRGGAAAAGGGAAAANEEAAAAA